MLTAILKALVDGKDTLKSLIDRFFDLPRDEFSAVIIIGLLVCMLAFFAGRRSLYGTLRALVEQTIGLAAFGCSQAVQIRDYTERAQQDMRTIQCLNGKITAMQSEQVIRAAIKEREIEKKDDTDVRRYTKAFLKKMRS